MSNRLANETSPYLLQHKDNPVDWYPWGDEAFERAQAEDKPLLLSVGYSTCHWCHVMARESFQDANTAALMNQWFVNVKVDREERPDVDGVYMSAVQALTGQGGWPMTVFLTPDGKPFYAGTYFPPTDGHGRPGFPRVLEAIAEAWRNEREKLLSSADTITEHLRTAGDRFVSDGPAEVTPAITHDAVARLRTAFDTQWGGFGDAPKFPSPSTLDFLLAYGTREPAPGEPSALHMALLTLVRMASGGMYDQLGGGFARYSVDRSWLVPHFEKMLYDNGQLVRTYLHAYQLTGDAFYERVVRETLTYLEREMLDAEGGFYSAQDADSEGIEGKFFVWTPDEVREALGEEDAAIFNAWFAVTEEGNFRDPHHPDFGTRNVLTTWQDAAAIASQLGLTEEQLVERIGELRQRMLEVREQRVKPGLDDKILTSWNGLAMGAFAEAARVLGDARYREIAEANAKFVREKLWHDGRLWHTYKAGVAKVDGMAEDYAYYGLGLVELYKLTGDIAQLEWAREMLEVLLRDFRDSEGGGFFETADHAEELLLRQKTFFDAATPSGNGATALLALWLGRYYANAEWEQVALEVLGMTQSMITQAPTGFGTLLQCVEFLLSPPREIVVVGQAEAREPLEREAARHFLPWVAVAPTNDAQGLPMFEGREPANGQVRAFVCENMVCQLPVSTPEALRAQITAQ
ncbi:MAG: thioredoxin domain-containing protein [Dehalococcoidia bacterium]|nr:thioredoxin domain-containing protein [Dehalococcoidia bacterium]